jgi:hypothetical protein
MILNLTNRHDVNHLWMKIYFESLMLSIPLRKFRVTLAEERRLSSDEKCSFSSTGTNPLASESDSKRL